MDVRFGLAAWSNRHFDHILYPLGTRHREWLPRYSSVFSVVEADILHHRVPEEEEVETWVEQTPEGFRFLPKLHKDVTHGGDIAALGPWWDALASLREADRMGPVLVQFPRTFGPEAASFDHLSKILDRLGPAAVEFRDPAWWSDDVAPRTERLLEGQGAALVWGTYDRAPAPTWQTAAFGYIRFVGTTAKRRDRWVTQRDRLEDILSARESLAAADWPEAFVIVTNRFEGNAVDSLPRVAAALGDEALAKRCSRPPARPLFPDAAEGRGRQGPGVEG